MTTKVVLVREGKEIHLTPSGDSALLAGACPKCGAESCWIQGGDMRIGSDDRHYASTGVALCCGERVGEIRAYPDTLFGLREDEAVLHGRPRVY